MSRLLLLICCAALTQPLFAQDSAACTASFDGSELIIRNQQIEQRWRAVDSLLSVTGLRDLESGTQWIAATPNPSGSPASSRFKFSKKWASDAVGEKSLVAELVTEGAPPSGFRFRIFPASGAISVQRIGVAPHKTSSRDLAAAGPSGIENEPAASSNAATAGALETLALAAPHLKLTQVELFDQTDVHNELVNERRFLLQTNESLRLQGNLFTLENSLTGNGLIFLKEAPLPHARPEKSDSDFEFEAAKHRLILSDSSVGTDGRGYRFTTLVYSGGQFGVTRALQDYQRQVRPYKPGRDGMFLSNTWGDRSRDARINAPFITKEIEAGARLGVDVVQVDDGWEHGLTKNSATAGGVWNGFWAADPSFWEVNRKRFPEGLEPVIELARKQGMGFGLWFAPDSSNDFANWDRDAARLLEIHRTLGVNYFKIDGVKATSKLSEERLALMFNKVLTESKGRVVFDLDVTAEIRPGYFGSMNVGPIFVENRYTDRHSYWPHQTLRNLWTLARYVDPLRLRIEFLNQARNNNLYADDPLAPAAYSPSYLFATTMMANPLGWFETSGLPPRYFNELQPLVQTWKKERQKMQSGRIYPIGESPDGVAWTGFLSLGRQSNDGYLLVFRENNTAGHWSTSVPASINGATKLKLLAGSGTASVRSNKIEIDIPNPLNFAWFRITDAKEDSRPR